MTKKGEEGCDCATCQHASDNMEIRIVVMFDEIRSSWLQPHADDFNKKYNQTVKIIPYTGSPFAVDYVDWLLAEENFAAYDGMIVSPTYIGTLSTAGILADLTDFVERRESDVYWSDILPYYRKWNGIFGGRIKMMIMDDNANLLFFRRDLFELYKRRVPRTWEEYNQEAEFFHNLEGDPNFSGSCVKRMRGCGLQLQLNMIYSPKTQTMGTESGSMFDPENTSTINIGAVSFLESLRVLEEQMQFGSVNDTRAESTVKSLVDRCKSTDLVEQRCALSYGPVGMILQDYPADAYQDFLGIERLPGSTTVLDRDSDTMVQCTPEICPFSKHEKGLGWVNYAPFMGSSNVGAGVSNYADPIKQEIATAFFGYVSTNSLNDAVPWANASATLIYPFRRSHLSLKEHLRRGYEKEFAKKRIKAFSSFDSPNADPLPRAPGINNLLGLMESSLDQYLNQTVFSGANVNTSTTDQMKTRMDFSRQVKKQVDEQLEVIGREIFFESYQRSLGIYVDPGLPQYVDAAFYAYGYTLCAVIIFCALGSASWSFGFVQRNDKVLALSQPRLLQMASFGALLMGCAIIPLSIDDRVASVSNCDIACKVFPWAYNTGFNLLSGAIFSKIARIDDISWGEGFGEGAAYMIPVRRVLENLVVMLMIPNCIILLCWTIIEPPLWTREVMNDNDIDVSEVAMIESATIGYCKNSTSWFFVALLTYNMLLYIYHGLKLYICLGRIRRKLEDSHWIWFALAGMLQVWLVALTILLIVRNDKSILYFVRVNTIFFSAILPLVALLLPVTFFRQNTEKMLDKYMANEAEHKQLQSVLEHHKKNVEDLIKELRDMGVDVRRPKSVNRPLYFASVKAALNRQSSDDYSTARSSNESRVQFSSDTKVHGIPSKSRSSGQRSSLFSSINFRKMPWFPVDVDESI